MKLRDCEGQLQAAMRECDEMRMAIREKKGPWFDEVRANVEARVRDVMAHSRELESQIEQHRQLHRERLQDFSAERSRLAGEIKALRDGLADAEAKIAQAEEGAGRAQDRLQSALSETEVRAQQMNDLQAENRVLADSMRSMREECSEIWMKEQRMVAQMKSLDAALSSSRKSEEHLTSQLDTARSQLATQVSMNRDLMHRKEAVEWELMETQAQTADVGRPNSGTLRLDGRPRALRELGNELRMSQRTLALPRLGGHVCDGDLRNDRREGLRLKGADVAGRQCARRHHGHLSASAVDAAGSVGDSTEPARDEWSLSEASGAFQAISLSECGEGRPSWTADPWPWEGTWEPRTGIAPPRQPCSEGAKLGGLEGPEGVGREYAQGAAGQKPVCPPVADGGKSDVGCAETENDGSGRASEVGERPRCSSPGTSSYGGACESAPCGSGASTSSASLHFERASSCVDGP
eukprot:evm.model.scf_40.5 EVM.evm.TU.scf_40.5   scf_40:29274-35025(+)